MIEMKIRVPATSANLGPGFDVLGLALNLFNEFEFTKSDESKIIEGEEISDAEDNLIYLSYAKTFEKFKREIVPVNIKVKSNIPMSRGLGSSSACIVGGIVGAYLILDREINRQEILQIASEIEGHPDNVSPAIFGNVTATINEGGKNITTVIKPKNEYKFITLIPDFELKTEKARSVLPKNYSREDAVFNISRTALLISSLILGQDENLKLALEDKIHEDYRGELIPDFKEIFQFLNNNTLGCYLSGAGPTIMAIAKKDTSIREDFNKFKNSLELSWEMHELSLNTEGFEILY